MFKNNLNGDIRLSVHISKKYIIMQCWQKEEGSGFTPRLKLSKIACTVRLPYLANGGELEKLLCFISYTPLILGDSDADPIEFCSNECFETVFVPSWSDQFLQNNHVGGETLVTPKARAQDHT